MALTVKMALNPLPEQKLTKHNKVLKKHCIYEFLLENHIKNAMKHG
jgi:hypothetical protein